MRHTTHNATFGIAGAFLVANALIGAGQAQTPATASGSVPGIVPSGLGEGVDRDVARIRAATDQFKLTAAAEAAGYKRVTGCIEHQPAGAMGYHWQNNGILDTTLDVDRPEVLVYEKQADGSFKLNGVEFLVPISAWAAAEPPRIMGQALKRADSIGLWYLHVWTWKPSPSGLFADWNPDVTCGDGSGKHQ